jgi:hypothetical protein
MNNYHSWRTHPEPGDVLTTNMWVNSIIAPSSTPPSAPTGGF